jgi:hypothetical protein
MKSLFSDEREINPKKIKKELKKVIDNPETGEKKFIKKCQKRLDAHPEDVKDWMIELTWEIIKPSMKHFKKTAEWKEFPKIQTNGIISGAPKNYHFNRYSAWVEIQFKIEE